MEKVLYDINEAAKFLSVSKRTMERLIENDDITTVSLPGIRKTLFHVRDLERFALENRNVPATVPGGGHKLAGLAGGRRKA